MSTWERETATQGGELEGRRARGEGAGGVPLFWPHAAANSVRAIACLPRKQLTSLSGCCGRRCRTNRRRAFPPLLRRPMEHQPTQAPADGASTDAGG